MKYNKEDIDFSQISDKAFENLCYDLLVKYDFQNLIWREGGADNGRDIEGTYTFRNTIRNKETKWFFECKHYTKGVPTNELNSKLAWADAEQPSALVILISSYISNNARTWIEKIIPQKNYEIIVIEGEELKTRLVRYPDLIERYFSLDRYEDMFSTLKDYKNKFNINPSFEVLKEIIENINLDKLDNNDFGFILINFYNQFNLFESRNKYYGDFDKSIINRLLEHLKQKTQNTALDSFNPYKGNYDELGGTGMFEEFNWLDEEDIEHEITNYDFQILDLHLNHKQTQENWKIGYYLFILYKDVAFELFQVENTEIRIIKDFEPKKIASLALDNSKNYIENFVRYKEEFGT